MNRFLHFYVLFLFLSHNTLIAQKVSPYFPTPFVSTTNNRNETQITYFDLNFVNLKIQSFLSGKLYMTPEEPSYNLNNGEGTITQSYIEKIAINREPRKLIFTFKVFHLGDDFVIEQLKISGDNEKVLSFYVSYWSTSLNFDDIKKNEIVSNKFLQDHISYSYNNNKPVILIKNNTINSRREFVSEYSPKREKYDLKQKEIAEKKQEKLGQKKIADEKWQKQQNLKRNTKYQKYYYKVIKKRNKINFELTDRKHKIDTLSSNMDLNNELIGFMNDKKNGTYKIRVTYKLVYGKFEKFDLYMVSYEKPKSLLQMISY